MTECILSDEEEAICEICMGQLKTAIKPSCGHWFHSNCILKMLLRNKKHCPICKYPFHRHYGAPVCNDNTLENIMRGVINPLLQRQNGVSQRQIDEVARIFPNVPRWDIEAEINSVGDIQQAILNISEWM